MGPSFEPGKPVTSASGDLRPLPLPDEISSFFWDGARNGRLLLQRCRLCSCLQYPPDVACTSCQGTELDPAQMSGRGTLYSYTVVDRAFHNGFVDAVPYVVGLVELEEQPGLRILTNIIDSAHDALRVGMELEVAFEDRGEIVLPQFRQARARA